jgi:hypothetical protein
VEGTCSEARVGELSHRFFLPGLPRPGTRAAGPLVAIT